MRNALALVVLVGCGPAPVDLVGTYEGMLTATPDPVTAACPASSARTDAVVYTIAAGPVRPVKVEPVYARLGQQIATLRKKRNFTQEALGRRLQPPVSRASIANIESGRQRLLVHVALEICAVLALRPDELLGDFLPHEPQEPKDQRLVTELTKKLSISGDDARTLLKKLNSRGK